MTEDERRYQREAWKALGTMAELFSEQAGLAEADEDGPARGIVRYPVGGGIEPPPHHDADQDGVPLCH